nr:hypothetical protein GCM10020093_008500 [Planobispora longispora]
MSDREFRLAYVPGVTPAKWVNVWAERVPDVPLTLVSVTAAEVVGSCATAVPTPGSCGCPWTARGSA